MVLTFAVVVVDSANELVQTLLFPKIPTPTHLGTGGREPLATKKRAPRKRTRDSCPPPTAHPSTTHPAPLVRTTDATTQSRARAAACRRITATRTLGKAARATGGKCLDRDT
jgi:hypothetical protein|tara:strand:- start:1284 stop:1619 length:336 start_codon:yes stop_codon:yes gene_type:complete